MPLAETPVAPVIEAQVMFAPAPGSPPRWLPASIVPPTSIALHDATTSGSRPLTPSCAPGATVSRSTATTSTFD